MLNLFRFVLGVIMVTIATQQSPPHTDSLPLEDFPLEGTKLEDPSSQNTIEGPLKEKKFLGHSVSFRVVLFTYRIMYVIIYGG